jgi:hypothetical protein
MKKAISLALSFMLTTWMFGQSNSLFDREEPLDMALSISVKEVKKTKGDTSYIAHQLYYRNASGTYDSIKVNLRARGNSRMDICYFPPIKIKIDKKHAKGTLFEGDRKLKLVLPCSNQNESNDLILREYLCYKLYEVVTPYSFKTRLVDLDLTEIKRKKKETYKQKGILIEDADKTAKRFDAKLLKDQKVHPSSLHDTTAMKFDLFQYMISNTDWASEFEHNVKFIYRNQKVIAIPYDFDMSGFVDASYAVVSQVNGQQLPITSVRDRFYKGICQSDEVTQFVKKEFISKEQEFLSVPDKLNGQLSEKKIKVIKDYLGEFFTILKDDDLFYHQVLKNCRSIY